VYELAYVNNKIMTKNDMKKKLNLNINKYLYDKFVTNNTIEIKQKFLYKRKEELFKDNTTPNHNIDNKDYYLHKDHIYTFTDGSKIETMKGHKAEVGIFFKQDS
jgi:hypothetical protein